MNESIEDQLKSYVGQFVCLMAPNRNFFGILQTDGTVFGVPPHGFPAAQVKEIRKIEAPLEVNLARAVLVL